MWERVSIRIKSRLIVGVSEVQVTATPPEVSIRIKSRLIVGAALATSCGTWNTAFQSELNLGLLWGTFNGVVCTGYIEFQSELNLGLLWGSVASTESQLTHRRFNPN